MGLQIPKGIDKTTRIALQKLSARLAGNLTPGSLIYFDDGRFISADPLTEWIAGTANQITVTDDTDGTVTLSTPQDIATTSSPTWINNTLTGYLDFTEITEPSTPSTNVLRIYNEEIKGFSFLKYLDDGGMKRAFMRDSIIPVKNISGTTIAAACIVYATGSEDNVPTVDTAKADALATMPAIGVTIESIANGEYGRVMQAGLLENINTSAYSEGDVLYVSDATAGVPTATKPVTPNLSQEIGTVLVSDASVGAIQVVARGITGSEYGTIQDTFSIGNGITGSKTLTFNSAVDASIIWDESKFDFGTNSLTTTGIIDASSGEVLVEDNDTVEPTNKQDGYIGVAIVGGQPRLYFTVDGDMYYVEGSASAAIATGNPIGLLLTLTYNLE